MIVDDLRGLAVPVESLELLPGNPRRGNVDAVAASLDRFGQRKPVVARRSDRVVVAGNHTLQAARRLGWAEVAVVWTDDDEITAKAFALADNRTAELGGYDNAELAELIAEVSEFDEELLAATGWDADDLAALVKEMSAASPSLTDPDDVPDPPPARSVRGDVWLLGEHRVMCGDATVPTDVDRLMAGGLADMVFTDPPYGVDYVGKTADKLTIVNDSREGLEGLLAGAFASVLSACRPGAAVYVAAPAGRQSIAFAVALEAAGLFRQRLVWIKDRMVLGHSDYHYQHEDIYFGYTPGSGRMGRGGVGWFGDNCQTTLIDVDRPSASALHPTMKPVSLIERFLHNSAAATATVLDLFGGSGSTLMACEKTGRTARLMELDPVYVDVICRRWQEHTGTKPVAEATGNPHDFTDG